MINHQPVTGTLSIFIYVSLDVKDVKKTNLITLGGLSMDEAIREGKQFKACNSRMADMLYFQWSPSVIDISEEVTNRS